ncbi:fumarate hydratase C-terminal domain-containing protein [Chloroflexota bacterium]
MIDIVTPLSEEGIRELKVGDFVRLSGRKVFIVAMSNAARMLINSIDKEQPIFDLKGSIIYHCPCGFEKLNGEYRIRWVGATTSMMNEAVTPRLIELGARVIMGKGGMGKETLQSMQKYGAVYLATVGATSSLLARGVTKVLKMVNPDIWLCQIEVSNFGPAIVGMDAHGRNLFDEVMERAHYKACELASLL